MTHLQMQQRTSAVAANWLKHTQGLLVPGVLLQLQPAPRRFELFSMHCHST